MTSPTTRRGGIEIVSDGCATGWENCPNGEFAVTGYTLNGKGERRLPNLSECFDRRKIGAVSD